ncbi:TIGR01777 family oxidoreductase [Paraglaciecola sp. MB-3u-78]|uniref:TIGR01777 family oxidoreductase n=1 Tax=Paraglaciecola sp. MB-3u-78 TaxID=2058332 RepID=UPI000C336DF9|nr:TIGR01777 family oxidoreductase [Paraglaciecola sp. MB-3u-78]PKG97146.1 TIGR01777 family protein [Paraglaciecola sp. MB-3u-78]
MKILITGGSGLIGSSLIPILRPCDVSVYTRNVAMAEQILGHKIYFLSTLTHLSNLDDYDVVINLAGEPIADKKWTDEQKRKIEHSRWSITEDIVALINAGETPPKLLISGSAIGFYGRQQDQIIDEDFSSPHDEFSHQLCERWEFLARKAQSDKTRVCILRTGVVITKRGGALQKMLMPFKLGLGGPIGNGSQYMSWIHLEDMLQGIAHLITNESCEGVYNFTAPNPVTNAEFSRELAAALSRPCLFKVPEFVLRMMMGEMADLVLYGQRVVPKRLEESGYQFIYPEISQALDCLRK